MEVCGDRRDAHRPARQYGLGIAQRVAHLGRRPVSAGHAEMESGRQQFHDLRDGDIPVGDYHESRLANLGIGHAAIDGGVGYTYLNPSNKLEFSAVVGLTYNFENSHTQYQNGLDFHLDTGASYFLTQQINVGLVGYYFQQVTGDRGVGATLGPNESRVAGAGPQLNYFFPVGDKIQGVVNVKAYREFAAQNRPEGWNAWFTLAFSPAAPKTDAR
jgi:hypothetical protein